MITSGIQNALQRPILKTTLGQSGFLCSKSQYFSRFGEKSLLDNTTGIRYLNPSRRLPHNLRFHLLFEDLQSFVYVKVSWYASFDLG
jgi:hypothetical protein